MRNSIMQNTKKILENFAYHRPHFAKRNLYFIIVRDFMYSFFYRLSKKYCTNPLIVCPQTKVCPYIVHCTLSMYIFRLKYAPKGNELNTGFTDKEYIDGP